MYNRILLKAIIAGLDRGKIAIIYGTRQVGKTTLTREIVNYYRDTNSFDQADIFWADGDQLETQQGLSSQNLSTLKSFISNCKLLVVDEAQRIPNIGINLKILHDNIPDLKIIATGSSSFDLANKINEPLTGRSLEFLLTPLSFTELTQKETIFHLKYHLENLLIYGSYPHIYTQNSDQNKIQELKNLASNYLYKDILEWENIRKSDKLNKILKYLAIQIGGLISIHDLATKLEISSQTVEKYIDLLEKAFVIFRLKAYSSNQANELSKSFKVYFWDLGIRNTIIQNLNYLDLRNDIGSLWENYCVLERIKKNINNQVFANYYFWRNYDQNEVDFVEESGGVLEGFEFKYEKKSITKGSYNFSKLYPNSTLKLINKDNLEEFLVG
ncbi:MAG: ATP-binding protein [bacterium]